MSSVPPPGHCCCLRSQLPFLSPSRISDQISDRISAVATAVVPGIAVGVHVADVLVVLVVVDVAGCNGAELLRAEHGAFGPLRKRAPAGTRGL